MAPDSISAEKSYHHGDLRRALLDAAEAELAEKGPDGFSLRSVARRAGVSHAAPAYHFADIDALLKGLAQVGFDRLTRSMRDEQALAGRDPVGQFIASGIGYVNFALANPALFHLMFGARMAGDVPADTVRAGDAAFSVLLNAVSRLHGPEALKSEAGWIEVTASWSMVHGFAHLVIGGKMRWLSDLPQDRRRDVLAECLKRIAS